MSAIAAGATSAPAQPVPGAGSSAPEDSGNGTFSRMLQGDAAAQRTSRPAQSATDQARTPRTTDPAGDEAGQRPSAGTDEAAAAEDTRPEAVAERSEPAATETTAETGSDTDSGWPPPGRPTGSAAGNWPATRWPPRP